MTTAKFVAFLNTTVLIDGGRNKAGNTEAALPALWRPAGDQLATRMRKVAIDWGLWRCACPAWLPVGWNFGWGKLELSSAG